MRSRQELVISRSQLNKLSCRTILISADNFKAIKFLYRVVMVIVKIFQGIGNQLFQYAYARALSLRNGYDFKIDISYYIHYSEVTQFGFTYKRDYGLHNFNIIENIATEDEVSKAQAIAGSNRVSHYINRKLDERAPYYRKKHVKEKDTVFEPGLLNVKDGSYVEGYYTSEKYFKDYRANILNEFTLKAPVNEKNAEVIAMMQDTESVCISIRRTNFLTNPLHNVCNEKYYVDGLKAMNDLVSNMRVFIFSDDNEWVLKNFHLPYQHEFVTHNYPDFYEDLRLMAHCKHHIIPNSTFSWWGAWLSQYPGKKVIAPRAWLNSDTIDYSTVIPDDWIKIDNKI